MARTKSIVDPEISIIFRRNQAAGTLNTNITASAETSILLSGSDEPQTTLNADTATSLSSSTSLSELRPQTPGPAIDAADPVMALPQIAIQRVGQRATSAQAKARSPTITVPDSTIHNKEFAPDNSQGRIEQVIVQEMQPTTSSMKGPGDSTSSSDGFPDDGQEAPKGLDCIQTIEQFPRSLYGRRLHPFIQYQFSAAEICEYIPCSVRNIDGLCRRIRNSLQQEKRRLKTQDAYDTLMNQPKIRQDPRRARSMAHSGVFTDDVLMASFGKTHPTYHGKTATSKSTLASLPSIPVFNTQDGASKRPRRVPDSFDYQPMLAPPPSVSFNTRQGNDDSSYLPRPPHFSTSGNADYIPTGRPSAHRPGNMRSEVEVSAPRLDNPALQPNQPPRSTRPPPQKTYTSSANIYFAGYPDISDRLPDSLPPEDICQNFPNHLHGSVLQVFLQKDWDAEKIYDNLPEDCRRHLDARTVEKNKLRFLRKRLTECEKTIARRDRIYSTSST